MASDFQGQNSAVEGLDDAARGFYEANQARENVRREQAAEVNEAHKPREEEELRETPEQEAKPEEQETKPEEEQTEEVAEEQEAETEEQDDDPLVEIMVAGKREEVPLSEVLKGYQRQQDYTRKTEELAAQRRDLEAVAQRVAAAETQGLQQLGQLAGQLQAEIQRLQPTPQQMAELEQVDPGQAALVRQKMAEQQRMIAAANQAQAEYEKQMLQQRIPQERAALMNSVEDFAHDFDGTYAQVGSWVTSGGGLSPEEWQQVIDHRLVLIAWKAMQYDQGRQATRSATSRVRKKIANLPKIRPGVPKEPRDTNREQYDQAIANLQQGHQSNDDIAAAFRARQRLKD